MNPKGRININERPDDPVIPADGERTRQERKIGQDLLHSFAAEAKGYLPEILSGIVDFRHNPYDVQRLEEAHRFAHTIKGAAAMIGQMALSELASHLEEAIENFAAGRVTLSDEVLATISQVITVVGAYLENTSVIQPNDLLLLTEASRMIRRIYLAGGEDRSADEARIGAGPAREEREEDETPAAAPEVSDALLEVFLPEAEEHLRTMSLVLPALAEQPHNKELLQAIRRSAHSLKGSAAVVGFQELSRLAHRMEDLLDLLYRDQLDLTPDRMDLLFASTDALEDLTGGQVDPPALQALYESYSQLLGSDGPETRQAMARPRPLTSATEQIELLDPGAPSALDLLSQRRGRFARVPIEKLDEVVKLVTELIITRASFEQNLVEFAHQLEELSASATRLERVFSKMEGQFEASALGRGLSLRAPVALNGTAESVFSTAGPVANLHGFDDLELDRYTEFHLLLRRLAEVSNDMLTMDRELKVIYDRFDHSLNRQGRLSSELQDKVMRLRMVPLSTLSSRLARTVRTVAAQRGKLVRFLIEGAETQFDKTVIEEMADPLLHILRNAVDHGIESPAARQSKDKPPMGTIRLQALYEGTQIIVRITDDGAGIDPERLRKAAVSGGYLSNIDAAKVPMTDLFSLIFLPGFTTAPEVSEISGRGVGLDVARIAIHRLNGNVKVESQPDEGTVFTIRLPMTLAVMRALLVKIGQETFAIPLIGIKQVVKVAPDKIDHVGKEPVILFDETVYPLLNLTKLLNLKTVEEGPPGMKSVLLVHFEDRHVAIAVDEALGGREIVVKNMGNHLRQVRGVSGTTLTGNGTVVLILNLAELVQDLFRPRPQRTMPSMKAVSVSRRSLTVLVVDDSLSVRRVLSNLISSAGWKPVLAKDGLDALEMLPRLTTPPDIVLLDIEMPRMDGYELISALRNQKNHRHTPIVVLTSRAGQKHRDKAFEVGATDYLVKPYQDEVLLSLIRQLVHRSMAM